MQNYFKITVKWDKNYISLEFISINLIKIKEIYQNLRLYQIHFY